MIDKKLELRDKLRNLTITGDEIRLRILTEILLNEEIDFNTLSIKIKINNVPRINRSKLAYYLALLKTYGFITSEEFEDDFIASKKFEEGFEEDKYNKISFYYITDKGKYYLKWISSYSV